MRRRYELFAELRRTQPVYWQDIPDQPGYWAVLKHADVDARRARPAVLFSASEVSGSSSRISSLKTGSR